LSQILGSLLGWAGTVITGGRSSWFPLRAAAFNPAGIGRHALLTAAATLGADGVSPASYRIYTSRLTVTSTES
jgi:hypothetical protein